MTKNEIFTEIAQKVTEVTGVPHNDLIQSQREASTDARHLLVRALYKVGLTDSDTASLIGKTRQAVAHMRHHYARGDKWLLENHWQIISKWLANNYFQSK